MFHLPPSLWSRSGARPAFCNQYLTCCSKTCVLAHLSGGDEEMLCNWWMSMTKVARGSLYKRPQTVSLAPEIGRIFGLLNFTSRLILLWRLEWDVLLDRKMARFPSEELWAERGERTSRRPNTVDPRLVMGSQFEMIRRPADWATEYSFVLLLCEWNMAKDSRWTLLTESYFLDQRIDTYQTHRRTGHQCRGVLLLKS